MDGGRDAATAERDATMTADASPTATADAGTTTQARADAGTTAQAGGVEVARPPLAGRVSYVFSGRMPAQYSGWVFQDLTGPGWRWRQALRSVLMMLPFAIIIAVLPGPPGTRGMLVAFLLVAAAAMGLILASTFRNRRLVQNGFPPIVRPEEDEDDLGAVPAAPTTPAAPGATATSVAATDTPVAGVTMAGVTAARVTATGAGVAAPAGSPAAEGGYDPEDPEGINA